MATDENLSGVVIEYVDSVEKARELISWLGERRPSQTLAIDLETGEYPGNNTDDAFSPWKGRIRLAQIGDGERGWAIPWEGWRGVFEEVMQKWDGNVLLHNSAFDVRFLQLQSNVEIPWHRLHDSMIASRIISPTESAALKRLTSKYVDPKAAALQTLLDDKMRENKWTWGTVPTDLLEYHAYGALDCILTVRMWEKLSKDVLSGGKFANVYDLEMGVRRVCTQMELNGARINVPYAEEQYEKLVDHATRVRQWAENEHGINIASTKQVIDVFKAMGAEFSEYTPGGAPKTDKTQLQKFIMNHSGTAISQLAEQILAMRKSEKLASSYFKNMINNHIDGVLHPQINTLEARTGRMSISGDLALQTLPKREAMVRRAFIPRNEDECIISSDLDQVEFRINACLSGDKNMIDMFKRCDATGGDAFTEIMRDIYNDPTAEKSDKRRQYIKNYSYASAYGSGIEKMSLLTGVPVDVMQGVSDAFNARFPGIKKLSKKLEFEAASNLKRTGRAYIELPSGRQLPVDEEKIYAATNYSIQGQAGEILKHNIMKLDAAGLTEFLICPVHDEVVMSVPRSDVEEIKHTTKECMTTTEGWEVPLTAGCDGPFQNWGEAVE